MSSSSYPDFPYLILPRGLEILLILKGDTTDREVRHRAPVPPCDWVAQAPGPASLDFAGLRRSFDMERVKDYAFHPQNNTALQSLYSGVIIFVTEENIRTQ